MADYESEITILLADLNAYQKTVFAAITCKKLYPNYKAFQQKTNWGDYQILLEAQSEINKFLINDNNNVSTNLDALIAKVDSITPDTEDFDGVLASFALDACTSTMDLLAYIKENEPKLIVNIALYARDTVDMFIQEKGHLELSDPEFGFKIEHDSFMMAEKNRQRLIIEKLKNINHPIDLDLPSVLKDDNPIIDLSLLQN